MIILAHRGDHSNHPENSIAAFRAALDMGADGIETDVRIDAMGEPMLFHNRWTPDARPVASVPREELSRTVGYPVPSLLEALDTFQGRFWNLEIKTPDALDPALQILLTRSRPNRFLITSFWHNVIERAAAGPEVETGVLVSHRPLAGGMEAFLKEIRQLSIGSIVCDYETIDPVTVQSARRMGLRVYVHGVNTSAEFDHCGRLAVYGVITDHPDRLRQP